MASFEAFVPVLSMSFSSLVILCVNFPCYRVANSNTILSLSRRYLVLIFFRQIPFFLFAARKNISNVIMWKIFLYQVYTNLAHVPPTYRIFKNYEFSLSIKTYLSPYLVETEMRFSSGAGTPKYKSLIW